MAIKLSYGVRGSMVPAKSDYFLFLSRPGDSATFSGSSGKSEVKEPVSVPLQRIKDRFTIVDSLFMAQSLRGGNGVD